MKDNIVIEIEKIDFSHWAVKDYIEQVLLVSPQDKGVPIHFVPFPQPHELLVLNIGYRKQGREANDAEGQDCRHFFCGKTESREAYSMTLEQPMCIVQFKPHAWYAFSKSRVERLKNRVVKLKCEIGSCLKSFVTKYLPQYLLRLLRRERTKERAYQSIPGMLNYIDDHIDTVTVASLAETFRISEATLRRYFKKYVGMNANAYIRSQKVKKMTVRIYGNDYNIFSIQQCGFYDQSHFIREFKRIYNTTPTKFLHSLKHLFNENVHTERLFRACYLRSDGGISYAAYSPSIPEAFSL
jgi:AraC-like DNA-binding protein